ncbi:MAG: PIN domain-containing protein [Leptospiraceae bacterium]|nr:PIN domain-containing protein [Leptospiraceae bacterium]
MLKTIIDTGPIVAFFDEGDKYSKAFRNYFKTFQGKLFSTLAVITEASYLLDDNKERQLDFIEWIKDGAISVVDISGDDFALVHKYMKKYADTPMDFADASLVILAHKLGTKSILTLDSDFSVYRTIEGKKFDNILKGILV